MKNFAKKALVVLFVVVIAGMMFTGCSKKTSDTIKIGGSYKTLTCMFADKDGQDVTETVIANMTADDFVWTCFIDGTEYTNNSLVTWRAGAEVNQKKIKLSTGAQSYLAHTLTVKVTVNGVTASKDLEITE